MPPVILELSQELENIPLSIKGRIPDWLSGTLVRNGPVQFSIGEKQVEHWFDGLGMLHSFSFQNGQVRYSNQFLRSKAFFEVTEKKTFNYVGFASDPCRTYFKRLLSYFFSKDEHPIHNANINVAKLADQYEALYETPLPVRFSEKILKTLGVLDYQDALAKSSCFESAHPHFNVKTGEHINYIVDYGVESKYIIYRIEKESNQRQIIAEIPVKNPSYMHSFAITENYIILVEYPFLVNPLSFLLRNQPFIKNYHWRPQEQTQFLVVHKQTGQVVFKEKTSKLCFAFHHVNAYEEGNEIVIDIITYPDASIIDELAHHSYMDLNTKTLKKGNENVSTFLTRFHLSLDRKSINDEVLFSEVHELPRIHPSFDGKFYQYLYAADARKPYLENDVRKIYKIDVHTKNALFWKEEQCYPGEPVFIPSPQSVEEDDGIVIAIMMNMQTSKSFLICLNAKNLEEMGRAEVPHQIPQGLHGQYFS